MKKLFNNASLSPWQHIESRYQSSQQEFLNNFEKTLEQGFVVLK